MQHILSPLIRSKGPRRADRLSFDRLGIGLAGLCALHCLFSILVLSGIAVGGHFLFAPEIHRIGLVVAMVVAAVAIGFGAVMHRRRVPVVVALTGLSFMGGALVVPHGHEEFTLTLIGVALVALGHLFNLRAARAG